MLKVIENGCSINPSIFTSIFEPMFTTETTRQGADLGLSMMHDIVKDDFKGDIGVNSKVGEGTSFTIKLAAPPGNINNAVYFGGKRGEKKPMTNNEWRIGWSTQRSNRHAIFSSQLCSILIFTKNR